MGERLPVGVPNDIAPGILSARQGAGKRRDVIEGAASRGMASTAPA
jgi:hypothetical protein